MLLVEVRLRDRRVGLQRARERLSDLPLARYAAVKIEHEVVQADLLEALEDGVDRRALLGHEQDRLAAARPGRR